MFCRKTIFVLIEDTRHTLAFVEGHLQYIIVLPDTSGHFIEIHKLYNDIHICSQFGR